MRKTVAVVLALVATLWLLAPAASAQAPAPKVTITGLVDNLTTWEHNMSMSDDNVARNGDKEWYGRTRVRPDITAEVGTTKFVLGLELDAVYGQTGLLGTNLANVGGTSTFAGNGPNHFGDEGSFPINTDLTGTIQVKWAYTQFLLPLVPWKTTVRVGAQPFDETYKIAAYAQGDFAGLHFTTEVNPALKLNFTYVSIEEQLTGQRDGFSRGEDYGFIASVEITPFKGLDIRPIYSYLGLNSVTSGSTRQGRGGVANSAAFFPLGAHESRHTAGVDARWRSGPFSFDPTVLYQWGSREMIPTVGPNAATCGGSIVGPCPTRKQDMSAWFVDFRGGFQMGPLLLEGAAIYTTGNKGKDDIRDNRKTVNYYQPLDTDTSYYTGWAEIWALGVDYLQIMHAQNLGLNPGTSIGYDKYGLMRLAFRPSYAVTPAFTVRSSITANWTAEDVDTSSNSSTAGGLTPFAAGGKKGTSDYLGTEIDLGFQWRFAPNVALDVVGGYLFAGNALSVANVSQPAGTGTTAGSACPGGVSPGAAGGCGTTGQSGRNPQDIQTVVARIRYTF